MGEGVADLPSKTKLMRDGTANHKNVEWNWGPVTSHNGWDRPVQHDVCMNRTITVVRERQL